MIFSFFFISGIIYHHHPSTPFKTAHNLSFTSLEREELFSISSKAFWRSLSLVGIEKGREIGEGEGEEEEEKGGWKS